MLDAFSTYWTRQDIFSCGTRCGVMISLSIGLRGSLIFFLVIKGKLQVIIRNLRELHAMANALNFTETISLKDRSSLRHCERPACYNSPTVNRAVVIRATKSARATFSHVLSFEPSRLAVIKLTPKHHGHLNCLIFADTTHPYLSMPANARTQKYR